MLVPRGDARPCCRVRMALHRGDARERGEGAGAVQLPQCRPRPGDWHGRRRPGLEHLLPRGPGAGAPPGPGGRGAGPPRAAARGGLRRRLPGCLRPRAPARRAPERRRRFRGVRAAPRQRRPHDHRPGRGGGPGAARGHRGAVPGGCHSVCGADAARLPRVALRPGQPRLALRGPRGRAPRHGARGLRRRLGDRPLLRCSLRGPGAARARHAPEPG
mmetsp:Transcript_69383/g.224346  ORF Transcript_69383/g.224346 Transcript_69383/m.224346 type:complete len:216 (+) Transcript_69383:347-994(+)